MLLIRYILTKGLVTTETNYIIPIDTNTIYLQQYKDIVGIYGQK